VRSERTFGVEIECGYRTSSTDPWNNQTYYAVYEAMRVAKFPVQTGQATKLRYGVGRDGSGVEVRTPILKGDAGFNKLTKVMDFLFDLGCYITKSDGMHVHVGASELGEDTEAAKILARTWYNNQALIARMCSSHRLRSPRCSALQERQITKIGSSRFQSYPDYRGDLWNKEWGTRNKGLNFQSIPEHGTVEFRLHEGCLNATKAVAWVKFCQRLVDHAVEERVVLSCARSKTDLLTSLDVPEDVRAKLWPRQFQMPKTGQRVRVKS
jgi:hypothetical protein